MRRLAIAVVLIVAGCSSPRLFGLHTTIPARSGDPPSPQLDVGVDDPQGLVRSISAADFVETANPVDVVPGGNNAYRVTWMGGECDTRTTLTLGWVGVSLGIKVQSDESPTAILGCSAVGIRRQVILELKDFVPSTQISVEHVP